jgi:DNA-directed RNA polymerase subunit F
MEEEYLSLAEVKNLLEKEKDTRPSLTPEQQSALQHTQLFARLGVTKARELVKELMEVPMMTLSNAIKIVDILPNHADDVRAILAKERFALSKEDTDRVLQIVAKYL